MSGYRLLSGQATQQIHFFEAQQANLSSGNPGGNVATVQSTCSEELKEETAPNSNGGIHKQYKDLVHSQAKELTQLREKLREGRDASRSLYQHLKALLTPGDPDTSQGQDLQVQLAEGHRLAEHLVNKLSPESDEDKDEDVTDEEVEEEQESPAPRGVQKTEEKEVPQDSLEECAVPRSNSHSTSDSNQPLRSAKVTFEGDKVDPSLVVESECSQDEGEETPNILPGNQKDHEEEEGKAPVSPRNPQSVEPGKLNKLRDFLISPYVCLFGITIFTMFIFCLLYSRLSQELPDVNEQEQDSLDEIYLTPSVQRDLSDCHQPYSSTLFSLDDQLTCSALDVASLTQENCPQGTCSGNLSYYLSEVQTSQKQPEPSTLVPNCLGLQLDEGFNCVNGLARRGLYTTTCSFTVNAESGTQCPFQGNEKDHEEEEEKTRVPPRLSQELPDVNEQEVPEDSLDEIYLTPSVHHDLSDCHQPYSSTLWSLDDELTWSALDVASPTQETCPQGTCSGDLSYYLSEVQASQTQPEPSTLVPNCLGLQPDQGFDCGNGLAKPDLSSTACSFTANADSGTQCLSQELDLEPSVGMKNPLQLEGDAVEGSADNTQEHQVTGHIHASSVPKRKSIKR
ncbi:neuroblastoma breakpoint family member 4-like, partial [Cebus imitator]|uniref:neuroblastoma breakpoint family member 4-like n=1 Tax=Cebus imitator TaxID=2715852 RepID=UPI001899E56B